MPARLRATRLAWPSPRSEPQGRTSCDPRVGAARIPFNRAQAYYEAGRYGLAAQEFRASYDLLSAAGHPRALMVLLNLGRALERITGREEEARVAYQQVIDESARTPEFEETLQRAADGLRELNARMGNEPGEAEPASGSPTPTTERESGSISPIGPILLAVGGAALIIGASVALIGLVLTFVLEESAEGGNTRSSLRFESTTGGGIASIAWRVP